MIAIFQFFRNGIIAVGELLDRFVFSVSGFNVSLLDIFIGFVLMGIIITVFWKGAHS